MPVLELRDPTCLVHDVVARLQVEVIRVGEDGLRARLTDLLRGQRLDRRLRRHGDKRRGLDIAVRGMNHAGAAVLAAAFGQARVHVEA